MNSNSNCNKVIVDDTKGKMQFEEWQFEMNLNYCPHWTKQDANRELICNLYDEFSKSLKKSRGEYQLEHDIATKFKFVIRPDLEMASIEYFPTTQTFELINYNATMTPDDLKSTGSVKHLDATINYIGEFGEGIRVASVVFLRTGSSLQYHTREWCAEFYKDGNKARTRARKGCTGCSLIRQNCGNKPFVFVRVTNVQLCDLKFDNFLFLSSPESLKSIPVHAENSTAILLNDRSQFGKIYHRGVYVCSKPTIPFGVNILKKIHSFSRDRNELMEVERIFEEYVLGVEESADLPPTLRKFRPEFIESIYKTFNKYVDQQEPHSVYFTALHDIVEHLVRSRVTIPRAVTTFFQAILDYFHALHPSTGHGHEKYPYCNKCSKYNLTDLQDDFQQACIQKSNMILVSANIFDLVFFDIREKLEAQSRKIKYSYQAAPECASLSRMEKKLIPGLTEFVCAYAGDNEIHVVVKDISKLDNALKQSRRLQGDIFTYEEMTPIMKGFILFVPTQKRLLIAKKMLHTSLIHQVIRARFSVEMATDETLDKTYATCMSNDETAGCGCLKTQIIDALELEVKRGRLFHDIFLSNYGHVTAVNCDSEDDVDDDDDHHDVDDVDSHMSDDKQENDEFKVKQEFRKSDSKSHSDSSAGSVQHEARKNDSPNIPEQKQGLGSAEFVKNLTELFSQNADMIEDDVLDDIQNQLNKETSKRIKTIRSTNMDLVKNCETVVSQLNIRLSNVDATLREATTVNTQLKNDLTTERNKTQAHKRRYEEAAQQTLNDFKNQIQEQCNKPIVIKPIVLD